MRLSRIMLALVVTAFLGALYSPIINSSAKKIPPGTDCAHPWKRQHIEFNPGDTTHITLKVKVLQPTDNDTSNLVSVMWKAKIPSVYICTAVLVMRGEANDIQCNPRPHDFQLSGLVSRARKGGKCLVASRGLNYLKEIYVTAARKRK